MRRYVSAMLVVAVMSLTGKAGAATLFNYAPPPVPLIYSIHNDDYTVRVRTPSGEWQDLYEYRIRVDWDRPQDASLVYFDFDGAVEVEVQKNNGSFNTVSVLPADDAIKLSRKRNTVSFTLTRPERFSLQFDDDRLHNLHILAGSRPAPRPEGANVQYFGPGVHAPNDGGKIFPVKSGDTIYMDGGAILQGNFALQGLKDVHILGRGLIYNSGRAIEIDNSQNIRIEDLITVNGDTEAAARVANIRHSANVNIRNITGFTAGKWSDGLNISTSQHVRVDQAYLRVSDDAIVVYATTDCPICVNHTDTAPSPLSYDTFDIKVTNSVLWNDVAHAMYIGHFGDMARPRTISDVSFDNIDVLNLDEDDEAWEGAMAIFSGDATRIHDITFSNIRVDRIEEGKLIHIVVGNSTRYNKGPGAGISNVLLRNITYSGDGMPSASFLSGWSADAPLSGLVIENLVIDGKRVRSLEEGNMKVGPYVTGFQLK